MQNVVHNAQVILNYCLGFSKKRNSMVKEGKLFSLVNIEEDNTCLWGIRGIRRQFLSARLLYHKLYPFEYTFQSSNVFETE